MLSPEFERALEAIQETKGDMRLSALYGLSYLTEEAKERLEEAWAQIQEGQKRRILQALIDITETSFLVDFGSVFRFCLEDVDPGVRVLAMEGLWEDLDWNLASTFIQLLREDPATEVRTAAAVALGNFVLEGELQEWAQTRAVRVCEALFEILEAPQEPLETQRRALESLGYASDNRVPPLIEAAYYNDVANMRVSALLAMGRNADPRWAPMVLLELRNGDPEMRYEATRACGELQLAQAVSMLGDLTQDIDREVQETAIWALGQIGGPEARQILEARYEQGDEVICEAIEDALANLSLIAESFNLAYHELLDEELQALEDLEKSCLNRQRK